MVLIRQLLADRSRSRDPLSAPNTWRFVVIVHVSVTLRAPFNYALLISFTRLPVAQNVKQFNTQNNQSLARAMAPSRVLQHARKVNRLGKRTMSIAKTRFFSGFLFKALKNIPLFYERKSQVWMLVRSLSTRWICVRPNRPHTFASGDGLTKRADRRILFH